MHFFDYTNPNHIAYAILFAIIVLLIFALLRYKLLEFLKQRKVQKRFERGNKLEQKAKTLLKKKGFTIVDYQGAYEHKYCEDGIWYSAEIKPDYIVKKKGKQYIVEVKTGEVSTSAKNRNTRRQLLEYDYVIENDGVYLLDMENEELKLIQFQSKEERRSSSTLKVVVALSVVGLLVPYWQVRSCILLIILGIYGFQKLFK